MKKLLFLVCAAAVFSSCHHLTGSGNIITEKRQTGDFDAISASGGIQVELKNGSTSVQVEADDNILPYLYTRVSGGKLKIYLREHLSISNAHIKVYISASGITSLNASSASEIRGTDVLSGVDKLELDVSSAGRINAEVDAPQVSIESSSAGEINVKGRTKSLKASCSSAGNIHASDLFSETTQVEASSGSQADVRASVSIHGNASSGGDINYWGGGNTVLNTSSGGSVHKRD